MCVFRILFYCNVEEVYAVAPLFNVEFQHAVAV